MKQKKILKDIVLNIAATMLPLIVLQIIALPLIAKLEGSNEYGNIVVIISVFTVISFPLGNVINNTRLLLNEDYKRQGLFGDFNVILLISLILSPIMFLIYVLLTDYILNLYSLFLIMLIIFFSVAREYLVVTFRLELNFRGILVNNVLLGLGYLLGITVYLYTNQWEYVYLFGLIFSMIYIIKNTDLHKEPIKLTKMFQSTLIKCTYLYTASILKNLINHADKLLLLPLLGPTNVAIYYTAAIIGRVISMVINPISTVILSYLAKEESKNKQNTLFYLVIVLFFGILAYLVIIFISPYFLHLFYQEWADKSLVIIKYTAATSIVSAISALFHPFNLRYNHAKWQLYINGSYLVIYVVLALYLTMIYGLIGFSIAVLMASLFNLLLQLCIYFRSSTIW